MDSEREEQLPAGLSERVIAAVSRHETRRARILFWSSIVTGASSAAGGVFAYQYAAAALSRSGFANYFSLLGSDFDAVVSHWKEFALSLGESLPILALIALAAAIAVFLGSVLVFVDSRDARGVAFNARI